MTWEDMNPHERTLVGQLMEALFHVQTPRELVRCLEEFLGRLVAADCLALCVSKPGPAQDYHWLVAQMPPAFFERARDGAPSDFVQDAVSRQPNTVLRDEEMISRDALERNALYRISHDMGLPLEQVMSVCLVAPGQDWHGGFTAYRTRRRPFSEREQRLIQYVSRLLTTTLVRCRMFLEHELQGQLLDSLLREHQVALVVFAPPAERLECTPPAATLLRKWFAPEDFGPMDLPRALVRHAASLSPLCPVDTRTWSHAGRGESLTVTFTALARRDGPGCWQLTFQETRHSMLATWLEKLTPRERQIALLLVQGKSDKEISQAAGCAVGTVKKHLRKLYEKTETSSRADFIARALKPPD